MDPKQVMIMESAKKSFSLFGYKGTTMDQIAKIAGVGKATIYMYFENKEVLLYAIVQSLISEMKAVAQKSMDEGQTVFERIHSAVYSILLFRKEHELLIQLAHEVQQYGNQVAQQALKSIETEVIDFMRERIELGIASGSLKPCDSKITAFIVFKMYVALVFDWEQNNPPLTDEKISELLNLCLMKGLAVT